MAGVALFTGAGPSGASAVAVPLGADRAGFLRPGEMRTLEAVVDRVVPGVPEDTVPGAVAAGCHEAIDALLAAFTVSPPRIYAGAPFSDRGGATHNDFEDFLALDRYERKAWRRRITRPGTGYQDVYRHGLAAVDAAAGPAGFAALLAASHNGLKSIVERFGEEFPRLRIGIGPRPAQGDLATWVLSAFIGGRSRRIVPTRLSSSTSRRTNSATAALPSSGGGGRGRRWR